MARNGTEAPVDRRTDQDREVEKGVDDAIAAGQWETAYNLAPGVSDAAQHVKLMDRVTAAKQRAEAATGTVVDAELPAGDMPGPQASVQPRAFRLARAKAVLAHLNVRSEKHGAEEVPCADVKFRTNIGGESLGMFAEALRGLLFHKSGDPQDLADSTHEAPNLRMPELAPVEWKRDLVGAKVTVHFGLSDRSAIVLDGSTVTSFKLDPKEGGTVVVTFTAKVKRPEAAHIAKLFTLIKHEVDVSVVPPEAGWHVEEIDPEDGGNE